MQTIKVNTDELSVRGREFRVFDKLLITGTVYTARDAAHKRFFELLKEGKELPIPIQGSVIYYAGPTPAPEGRAIGSCGPTTSGRMDPYAPRLLDMGLAGMIGKGQRSKEVRDAIVRNHAFYACAIGGAGALASCCIKECTVLAFEDLGCESVKRLYLEDFPAIVTIDSEGGNIFELGPAQFAPMLTGAKSL